MENDIGLGLGFFVGMLLLVVLWEYMHPKRSLQIKKSVRRLRNLSLVVINSIAMRVLIPYTTAILAIPFRKNNI